MGVADGGAREVVMVVDGAGRGIWGCRNLVGNDGCLEREGERETILKVFEVQKERQG